MVVVSLKGGGSISITGCQGGEEKGHIDDRTGMQEEKVFSGWCMVVRVWRKKVFKTWILRQCLVEFNFFISYVSVPKSNYFCSNSVSGREDEGKTVYLPLWPHLHFARRIDPCPFICILSRICQPIISSHIAHTTKVQTKKNSMLTDSDQKFSLHRSIIVDIIMIIIFAGDDALWCARLLILEKGGFGVGVGGAKWPV